MPNAIARTLTVDDVEASFFQAYDDAVPGQLVADLSITADQVSSGKASFPFTDAVPKPEERKRGQPLKVNRLAAQEVEIVQRRYSNSVAIDLDDLADDNDAGTGSFQRRINELAEPYGELRYSMMLDVFLNNMTAYDGTSLIAASGRENCVNEVTASEVATLAVANASQPTPEELSSAITDLIGWMYGFKDAKGHAINRSAKEFTVFVPTAMWGSAKTAISANQLTSGQTAILNAINNGTGYQIDVQPEPLLTAADEIVVVRRKNAGRGAFIATERDPLDFKLIGEDTEYAAIEDEVLARAKWRGGAGPGEPRYIARGTLSAS